MSKLLALTVLLTLSALLTVPAQSQDDPPIWATRSAELYLPLVVGGTRDDSGIAIVTPTPTTTPTPTATTTPIPTVRPTLTIVTPTRIP